MRIVPVTSSSENNLLKLGFWDNAPGSMSEGIARGAFGKNISPKLKTLLALAHEKDAVWLDYDFFFSVELSDHLFEGFFAHLQLCLDLFRWAVVVKRELACKFQFF